ncbi:hypothetical protein [Rhodopila globiformis]|uniref:Uncharacterized protein n=1 Tax=Rhodopila globiformis TaxID=1071 RepID=A0A2S6NM18_RHOGL|nr:hypothetical protein [Rhodopila globiformis]PPQ36674.1 hypothetical protein CCS01_04745 [Rhodopila globiformis]
MTDTNEETGRFGGPGSSHQDRAHPGRYHQPTGRKGGGDRIGTAPAPGSPTNQADSRVSGGGGERDSHHTHTGDRS